MQIIQILKTNLKTIINSAKALCFSTVLLFLSFINTKLLYYENNNTTLFFGFWLLAFGLQAQDYQWQWAKSGGGSLKMQSESNGQVGVSYDFEHIRDIVTDSDNNYYFLGKIAHDNSHVDGNEVTTFGNAIQGSNIIITSIACDGTYRWSRVIGGG